MSVEEALRLAQRVAPLDLVARIDYIEGQRDRCDADDLGAWTEALDLTRNGVRAQLDTLTLPVNGAHSWDAEWRPSREERD